MSSAPPANGTPVSICAENAPAARAPIPGGPALLGTDRPLIRDDGEGPARTINLKPFWLDRHAVTLARFRAFVDATSYSTDAERFGWSYVFRATSPGDPPPAPGELPWWRAVEGAFWRYPTGPDGPRGDESHPATHISWNDAAAFAVWAGGRLPREAEWEHAARGGRGDVLFPWGDAEPDDKTRQCNIWDGAFPLAVPGMSRGPMSVDAFTPNGFDLYNTCGNVWEWTSDAFRVRSLRSSARRRDSAARRENERVLKGGSFLCHKSYCFRYRIAARTGRSVDTSAAHTGFRVAYDSAA